MFSRSIVLILLAFVLFANALPLRHGRRTTCRPHTAVSVSSAVPSATSKPTVNDDSANTSVVKGASSTVQSTKTSSSPAKSTKTSSAVASASATPSKVLSATGKLAALFPVSDFSSSWSTSSLDSNPLPLSDATFRPTKLLSELSHNYVNAPDGKLSMQAHYPEGSYTFTHSPLGGLSFYAPGPSHVDLTTAKEATFSYSVYFDEGFDFNKGGKLPGLYGGNSAEEATSCSGGRRDPGCFSARLMWRTDGAGELYTYLPSYDEPAFKANEAQCNIPPFSTCNPTYGASVGRGAFNFVAGGRTTVSQRVRLNDVGKANGELELFANGESVINVSGLILTDSSAGRIFGIQMQTFFGGASSTHHRYLFVADIVSE
ncbi:hypothetical protein C0991_009704 [Blastosporella zonata]|nr:hypothetical protein C0991_009704 [Blastosporella zonata]